LSKAIDFPKRAWYNAFGAVLVWAQVVFLLEVEAGSTEGGEGMLELLLAMGFVYLCYAIALHEANKKN